MLTQVLELLDSALAGVASARRVAAFWGPVTTVQPLVGPFLAVAAVVSLAVLTGIAVGTLATLIVVLLALYLLLTEVFGVSVEVVRA
jgi:hypothetical protein